MLLRTVAICYAFAIFFRLSSEIALKHNPVTSWLVPMLTVSPSRSTSSDTMTLWLDGDASSLSITHVCSPPMSGIVYVKSMFEVIILRVGRIVIPGLLFCIRSYAFTILSSFAASLLFPQCTFHSGLWALKSSRMTTLLSFMLSQSVFASALLFVLLSAPFYAVYSGRWWPYIFTIRVLLFFFPPLFSNSETMTA